MRGVSNKHCLLTFFIFNALAILSNHIIYVHHIFLNLAVLSLFTYTISYHRNEWCLPHFAVQKCQNGQERSGKSRIETLFNNIGRSKLGVVLTGYNRSSQYSRSGQYWLIDFFLMHFAILSNHIILVHHIYLNLAVLFTYHISYQRNEWFVPHFAVQKCRNGQERSGKSRIETLFNNIGRSKPGVFLTGYNRSSQYSRSGQYWLIEKLRGHWKKMEMSNFEFLLWWNSLKYTVKVDLSVLTGKIPHLNKTPEPAK